MARLADDDTIAALATPPGEGGIAVIRLSGSKAFAMTEKLFRPAGPKPFRQFESHTVHLGEIMNGASVLDQVLITLFKPPHSYTGEAIVEISAHGGMRVSRSILELLYRSGARPAEPGEFTKRAFLNRRLDLTQAEAVLDLIKAKSEKSSQLALQQLAGSLSQHLKQIKEELMQMYAHMEAFLDFPEEDLEIFSDQEFFSRFGRIRAALRSLSQSFQRGALIREGASVVLVGKPNAGKSSIFNALLERDRALVSEVPGTTRDALEESIEIQGFYIRLIDTAGLNRQSKDLVEQMGMERTRQAVQDATLCLFVADGASGIDAQDTFVMEGLGGRNPDLLLINKADLPSRIQSGQAEKLMPHTPALWVSSKTRQGFAELEKIIADKLSKGFEAGEGGQITRLRHKTALEKAETSLAGAEAAFLRKESLELVIVDVKTSLDELRELIGEIYSDDLLEIIFSEFCIGK